MTRETPQPKDLKTQMIQQFDLLREMSERPDGKGGLPKTEEYYRNKIAERSPSDMPFIRHLYSLNEEPPSIMRRYNTLATITNLATQCFLTGHMKYSEYCAFAQAAEYDVLSHYGDIDDADDYLGIIGSQVGDSTGFFEEFSKMVDAAANNNYSFNLGKNIRVNGSQFSMVGILRNVSNTKFSRVRAFLGLANVPEYDSITARSDAVIESAMNELDLMNKYNINPDQAGLSGQYELDAILSWLQQFKGL